MAPVQLITDSTCFFPPDMEPALRAAIRIVRPTLHIGTQSWAEGTLPLDAFYSHMAAGAIARSSQPSPAEFLTAYREALADGPALAILLSARLSGTFSTGQVVADEFAEQEVRLFDSGFFSSALGYLVDEAATLAQAGATRAQIIARLTWRRAHTALFFTINTLDYLRRSGRASTLQASVATLLDIKPVLAVQEGTLVVVGRVRSRPKSLDELVSRTVQATQGWTGPFWASAMHGAAEREAGQLLAALGERLPLARAFVAELPATVALHGGPGAVGLMVTPAAPPQGHG